MKTISGVMALLGSLLVAATANADVPTENAEAPTDNAKAPIGFRYWHVDGGLGLRGGGGTVLVEAQAYIGVFLARKIVVPHWSPFVGLGPHVGWGNVHVDDPRGMGGFIDVERYDIGPELRFGMAHGTKVDMFERAWPNMQLYVTTGLSAIFAETISNQLPEAGSGWAVRAGAGASFPALWSRVEHQDPGTWIIAVLPNTFAFDMEIPWNEPARRRYGIRIGYGF